MVSAAHQDISLARNVPAEVLVSLHVIQNAITTTPAQIVCIVVGPATIC